MPALSLKTKLVFAITAMVVAIVATLSTLYISEVVHQRIHEVYHGSRRHQAARLRRIKTSLRRGPEQFQD